MASRTERSRQEADEGHEVECEQADPEEGDSPPRAPSPWSVRRVARPHRTSGSRRAVPGTTGAATWLMYAEHPAAVDCPAAAPPSRAGSAVVRHAVGNRPGSWA